MAHMGFGDDASFRVTVLLLLVFCISSVIPVYGQFTNIADEFNALVARSKGGKIYGDGSNTGVIVRLYDGIFNTVVPTSLIHNDIVTPTNSYTCGNPWCPNNGNDGYFQLSYSCPNTDNFQRAALVQAIGPSLATSGAFQKFGNIQDDDWGFGVFYATDSNSSDKRCRRLDKTTAPPNGGWDCQNYFVKDDGTAIHDTTKKGSGNYPAGNPFAGGGGGGTGCHFKEDGPFIDQMNAFTDNSLTTNLVEDKDCQCNYVPMKDDDQFGLAWGKWVDTWIYGYYDPKKVNQPFLVTEGTNPVPEDRRAPQWGVDQGACWMNNVRDMINLQNAIYKRRGEWSNEKLPQTNYDKDDSPEQQRKYWGWNEIPLDSQSVVDKRDNWDALVIRLPTEVCGGNGVKDSVYCLNQEAQDNLECQITAAVERGDLVPGQGAITSRPGSYMLFMKTEQAPGSQGGFKSEYENVFYCEEYKSPNGHWEIKYVSPSDDANGFGSCYLIAGQTPYTPGFCSGVDSGVKTSDVCA